MSTENDEPENDDVETKVKDAPKYVAPKKKMVWSERGEDVANKIKLPVNRHGAPKGVKNHILNLEPGEFEKICANVHHWYTLPKCNTDEERIERIEYFFDRCLQTGEMPSVEKLAVALKTTVFGLRFMELAMDGYSEELGEVVRNAKATILSMDAELVNAGKMPYNVYEFRAKAFHGILSKNTDQGEYESAKKLENPDEVVKRITLDIADSEEVDYEIVLESNIMSKNDKNAE